MRFWDAGNGRPNDAVAPQVDEIAPDIGQQRMFGLFITDTYRWLREWAAWRVRFSYDNERPGMTDREVSDFVRNTAVPLCCWTAEAIDNVLDIHNLEDLKTIFRCFGSMTDRHGQIAAAQSRTVYLEAARLAVQLAALARSPENLAEQEVPGLPDVIWSILGQGLARIATTTVRGHRILVRHGYVGVNEMWLVDVDGYPGAAQWRARADAMSKLSVGMAIRMAETHQRGGR
jgi:hypothetical protein